jgi:hypothetical protein
MNVESQQDLRIKLVGARFQDGQLPIDSLIELEKYQCAIRTLAIAEWKTDHPNTDLPEDFASHLGLTIKSLDKGSADLLLAFEQTQNYSRYQTESRAVVDATLLAAHSGMPLPYMNESAVAEVHHQLSEVGLTLKDGQELEYYPNGPNDAPMTITISSSKLAREALLLGNFWAPEDSVEDQPDLSKDSEALVGRITEVDVTAKSFRFESLQFGSLKAWFKESPELLVDIKRVLDSTPDAPLVRLDGDLQRKAGRPWRLTKTNEIQVFFPSDAPWSGRLEELASIQEGWGDGSGQIITFLALDAAKEILVALTNAQRPQPNVFPSLEGGLSLEWVTSTSVKNIEISPDGIFWLFQSGSGDDENAFIETLSLEVARNFAIGVFK